MKRSFVGSLICDCNRIGVYPMKDDAMRAVFLVNFGLSEGSWNGSSMSEFRSVLVEPLCYDCSDNEQKVVL